MLKLLAASLLLFLASGLIYASDSSAQYVDLNAPGALERLRTRDPGHYEKVKAIINGLGGRSHGEVPQWLRASFDAKDVFYSQILLVTHPPQRDLSFVLGKTTYRARITLEGGGAKVYPVRNQ